MVAVEVSQIASKIIIITTSTVTCFAIFKVNMLRLKGAFKNDTEGKGWQTQSVLKNLRVFFKTNW